MILTLVTSSTGVSCRIWVAILYRVAWTLALSSLANVSRRIVRLVEKILSNEVLSLSDCGSDVLSPRVSMQHIKKALVYGFILWRQQQCNYNIAQTQSIEVENIRSSTSDSVVYSSRTKFSKALPVLLRTRTSVIPAVKFVTMKESSSLLVEVGELRDIIAETTRFSCPSWINAWGWGVAVSEDDEDSCRRVHLLWVTSILTVEIWLYFLKIKFAISSAKSSGWRTYGDFFAETKKKLCLLRTDV